MLSDQNFINLLKNENISMENLDNIKLDIKTYEKELNRMTNMFNIQHCIIIILNISKKS